MNANPKTDETQFTKMMFKELKTIFYRRIKKNKWLSKEAESNCLLKLKYLKCVVGASEIGYEDPILNYVDDAYTNISILCNWRVQLKIDCVGNKVINIPSVDWDRLLIVGKQPYLVNAFYTPSDNSIFIPQAYLQKPFIDLVNESIEYNMAFIGFTLGHEMGHCFDLRGIHYNYKGNFSVFFNKNDLKKYMEKINDIRKKFYSFIQNDNYETGIGLNEEYADLIGFQLVEEYLRDYQEFNNFNMFIRKNSFILLFSYFAIQSRQILRVKQSEKYNLLLTHPSGKYRVNFMLSGSNIFKNVFDIEKHDKMYWKGYENYYFW
jgi:putative endopeptidase